MQGRTLSILVSVALLAGCGSSSTSWMPWTKEERPTGAKYTPEGAKGYGCAEGKRLLVRFDSDGKSAWVIYPDREMRLDRVSSASGEEFSRAGTTLSTKDGETTLIEGSAVQFANCKPEGK